MTINYGGNDNYNGSSIIQRTTIDENVVEAEQSSSSSNDNAIYYDSKLNVYYDRNRIVVDRDIRHLQSVGKLYRDLVEWSRSGCGMGD